MSLKHSYDSVASVYQISKKLPFRKYVEEFTIFKMLGDVTGKKVLDLACGGGYYTRLFKQRGASKVVGVDVSPLMIQIAEDEEKSNPIGCTYICSDAADIDIIDQFDFVVGAFFCANAETKEKMRIFAQNIFKNLKKGGKYVGIEKVNCRHTQDELSPYGICITPRDVQNEGDLVYLTIKNPDQTTFGLEVYDWVESTYEESFLNAGLKSFQWEGPFLDPNLPAKYPVHFWDTFINVKGIAGMSATK